MLKLSKMLNSSSGGGGVIVASTSGDPVIKNWLIFDSMLLPGPAGTYSNVIGWDTPTSLNGNYTNSNGNASTLTYTYNTDGRWINISGTTNIYTVNINGCISQAANVSTNIRSVMNHHMNGPVTHTIFRAPALTVANIWPICMTFTFRLRPNEYFYLQATSSGASVNNIVGGFTDGGRNTSITIREEIAIGA